MKKIILLTLGLILLFCGVAFAGAEVYETATITASGNWTDELYIKAGSRLDVSIYNLNSLVATIVLQKKFPEETTWDHEVDTWNITAASVDQENTTRSGAGGAWYRLGCDGNYTSGNATVRIGQYQY